MKSYKKVLERCNAGIKISDEELQAGSKEMDDSHVIHLNTTPSSSVNQELDLTAVRNFTPSHDKIMTTREICDKVVAMERRNVEVISDEELEALSTMDTVAPEYNEIFSRFDADGDGRISKEELRSCFEFYNLPKNYLFKMKDIFRFDKNDGTIEIAKIFQDVDGSNGKKEFLMDLALAICKKEKGDEFVVGMKHMANLAMEMKWFRVTKSDPDNNNLRSTFLALTGQAAFTLNPNSSMAGASSAAGHLTLPLKITVASNALAFFFLVMSFWFGARKQIRTERIIKLIGIGVAVVSFLLMAGFSFA